MQKVTNHIKKIFKDKAIVRSSFCCLILAICHTVQFTRSGAMPALIRAIFAGTYIPLALIFGRKIWSPFIIAYALAILYFNRFNNYTSFILILFATGLRPRLKIPAITIYALAVLVCLILYRDQASHSIIHSIGCYFFYLTAENIMKRLKKPALKLTHEEKNILRQITEGRPKCNIEGFSEATVHRKLKEARERNSLLDTDTLLEQFMTEN